MSESRPEEQHHLREIPTRELLRLSQINVTENPELGFTYAIAAFYREYDPHDPTASGEAAAKAALRGTQAGHSDYEADSWLSLSDACLALVPVPRGRRELLATSTLGLRIMNLRLIRDGELNSIDKPLADHWKDQGAAITKELPQPNGSVDRYITMFDRQRAVYHGLGRQAIAGMRAGAHGVVTAVRADDEGKPKDEHRVFVRKQVAKNMAAALFASSSVIGYVPALRRRHQRLARFLA